MPNTPAVRQNADVVIHAPLPAPRILTLQRRARSLGRIRIGQVVPTRNGKTRPEKLDRFRLTSASWTLLEKVAELYGGEVREWTPQGGGAKQWEVITTSTRLPIMVPPQPVSQFLETWAGGLCTHRCDGVTNVLTGDECDPEDPAHLEARPTTRLNVVLRDVEGIGVWRLESKGWNAAQELPDVAEFLAQAGGYVDGWLSLEERTSRAVVDGQPQTRRFMVPIIEIGVTPAQLMAGQGRVQAPSVEGPVARAAIEAPKSDVPDYLAQAQQASTFETVVAIRGRAEQAGHLTPELDAQLKLVANSLRAAAAPQPDADGAYDAEVVDDGDADAVWQQILTAGGQQGMTTTDLIEGFAQHSGGVTAATATAAELQGYLEHLRAGVPA